MKFKINKHSYIWNMNMNMNIVDRPWDWRAIWEYIYNPLPLRLGMPVMLCVYLMAIYSLICHELGHWSIMKFVYGYRTVIQVNPLLVTAGVRSYSKYRFDPHGTSLSLIENSGTTFRFTFQNIWIPDLRDGIPISHESFYGWKGFLTFVMGPIMGSLSIIPIYLFVKGTWLYPYFYPGMLAMFVTHIANLVPIYDYIDGYHICRICGWTPSKWVIWSCQIFFYVFVVCLGFHIRNVSFTNFGLTL